MIYINSKPQEKETCANTIVHVSLEDNSDGYLNFQQGEILHFDKPYGWTSFRVVKHVRHFICERLGVKTLKVGHAGTLDPLATGVVTICTGRATKLIEQLQYHTKEYEATLCLGATTPSFDQEHPLDATFSTTHITRELVEQTLQYFKGEIWQVPPVYSACNVDGKRAYLYARKGQEVELKPKLLVIDEIELLDFQRLADYQPSPHRRRDPEEDQSDLLLGAELYQLKIRVVCSKGTYIRALARDIGEALHCGAHLMALRRTRVGEVRVERCLDPDQFEAWLKEQKVAPFKND
ncbi:MAG: tRNA pseudouridine(55) synthase TruB [Bacteroidaceae bacterium]|nr:tRNA pseudouridine(55) synthase TruB [Bacteroidaceae bacterium]